MRELREHIDPWSVVIIAITLVLFVAALFIKGIGHDLLLEGGVFLVSVKLIMMAYKNSVASVVLDGRLAAMERTLARIEAQGGSREGCDVR